MLQKLLKSSINSSPIPLPFFLPRSNHNLEISMIHFYDVLIIRHAGINTDNSEIT